MRHAGLALLRILPLAIAICACAPARLPAPAPATAVPDGITPLTVEQERELRR